MTQNMGFYFLAARFPLFFIQNDETHLKIISTLAVDHELKTIANLCHLRSQAYNTILRPSMMTTDQEFGFSMKKNWIFPLNLLCSW